MCSRIEVDTIYVSVFCTKINKDVLINWLIESEHYWVISVVLLVLWFTGLKQNKTYFLISLSYKHFRKYFV